MKTPKKEFNPNPNRPSKRSLHRALRRAGMNAERAAWNLIPHRKNEEARLSIVRRCEAILRSWAR